MEVYAGSEQIGIASETHGGEISAVRASPQAVLFRIDDGESLQVFGRSDDVFVFGTTAPSGVERFAKGAAIHDAETVVDRQHNVALARQVLIHGVRVVVVVHVVKSEHHLPDGAAVAEDQCGTGLRTSGGHKELTVNLQAIFAGEDDRLGQDQLRRGKVGGEG